MLKHIYTILLIGLLLCSWSISKSQAPSSWPSGKIQLALKKMQVLGSVLYVAAHPDDENTAMLAYLANDRLVRTAYLSLTRGDGGQNLIGAEQRELMGLIRTQELLQARRIDGAEQFFSRANDFGFSKNAKETFEIWEKDKILSDVVRTIRTYRPDVIITRFPPTRAAGHGHHEASAMLALEAFEAAADPKQFPEQLEELETWQVKRVLWNAYSRRKGRFTNLAPDSLQSFQLPIGTYNPLLGKSHQVIASESRSMHRSQGFGSRKDRSSREDSFGHLAGDPASEDIFDGIDLSWNRIPQGKNILELLQKAYQDFRPEAPERIVPTLMEAYRALKNHPQSDALSQYWITQKRKELTAIIQACLGLWLDALAQDYAYSPGDSMNIVVELVNRSAKKVYLTSLQISNQVGEVLFELDSLPKRLEPTKMFRPEVNMMLPENEGVSQPYWLILPPQKGMFKVSDAQLIGKPENEAIFQAQYKVEVEGEILTFQSPVHYKWTRPDEGELYRGLEVSPPLMVNLQDKISLFVDNQSREMSLEIKAGQDQVKGKLFFEVPSGWKVEPAQVDVDLQTKGQE
ncbi:MAG: PIG-L family deacetylase, partial [Bacteroidota bacterium]